MASSPYVGLPVQDDIHEGAVSVHPDPYIETDEADEAGSGVYFERFASSSTERALAERAGQQLLFSSAVGAPRTSAAELNGINFLNVASYSASLFVTLAVGMFGLGGLVSDHREVSERYQTLITPASWTYTIWVPIFVAEGVFVVSQLHHLFRARPVVQEGARFFFFYACLAQIAWTLFFSFRMFILSFLSMVAVLISLLALLLSQYISVQRSRSSRREYWLLRFPFSLHCGWIFVMTVVNFNVMNVKMTHSASEQLATAIIALSVLLPVGFFFLAVRRPPDFVVPAVLIWSYIGIGWELRDPQQSIEDQFGDVIISGIRSASYLFAFVLLGLFIPTVLLRYFREHLTIQVIQLD